MENVSDIIEEALGHQQAGDLGQAEELYNLALESEPKHSEALHCLGMIAYQKGQHNKAF